MKLVWTQNWEDTLEESKWLSEKSIHDITHLTIRRIQESVRAKHLEATILFVDFSNAFDSIHWGKMAQILLAYGLSIEAVAAII